MFLLRFYRTDTTGNLLRKNGDNISRHRSVFITKMCKIFPSRYRKSGFERKLEIFCFAGIFISGNSETTHI